MRLTTVGIGVAAFFVAGIAFAAPNKGGNGPSAGGSSAGGEAGGSSGDTGASRTEFSAQGGEAGDPDIVLRETTAAKPWEVGGVWETHRLFRQEDLNGVGDDKLFNVLGLYAQYDITQYDRVKLRGYVYERFTADQGETGFRADDLILQYIRRIPLPNKFTLRVSGWVTAPTSFSSQLEGLITAPRLTLDLEKKFGRYVTADVRAYSDWYIVKYASAQGGNPSVSHDLVFDAEVEANMPFYTPLSIGASVATGYDWYYQPNSTNDPNTQVQMNGTVGDSTFTNQPIQQTYSAEVFARYEFPSLAGMKSDFLLAVANGDPSLGSNSVLHDGVGHVYAFYRQTAEAYAALTVKY
jgi:hypothetical protein